jgi:WD40 repeat protein
MVALSGFDGTLTVWDPNGLPAIARVLADAPPAGGTFSPDGTLLAVSGNDDTIVLYDVKAHRPIRRLSIRGPGTRNALDGAMPAAFSPDSRAIAVGDRSGNVQLFDARSQRAIGAPIATDGYAVVGLTFSPDGRSLVATNDSSPVNGARVIDVATRHVRVLDPPLAHALSGTFRPDGRELVATVGFGGAGLFPVADGKVGRGTTLNAAGSALPNTAAFSPDGKLLAIGRTDGSLSFLDATSLKAVGTSVPIASGLLTTITWSHDGQLVAVQDVNADNSLVDVGQRARIGKPFAGVEPGRYGTDGFSPDGHTMVLPGPRGTTVWNLDVRQWPAKACMLAGRDLTPVEWNTYFSSAGAYRSTCASSVVRKSARRG